MNLGAVVPLISGTTAHPSGTTAGGAEHGTTNAVAVVPPRWAVVPPVSGSTAPVGR